ncbi:zinc-binding dehydrogenase [Mycobacterium sp. MS1601]|uniref:zinc-binding dehydrogenase n=1 Tax=Mycobacterium sp. MS1601 TaxID=1936029 RepID=UPI0012FAAEA9
MTTDTMRAAVWTGDGPALQVETIPVPQPKRGEALVKVTACGVCHTDLHVMKGEVAFPSPAVLGHEISGSVVALGPDTEPARGVDVGAKVVGAFIMPCGECRQCQRGRDDMCLPFFAQNRLKGTLYDGTTRLERADGSPLAMYSMAGLAEYSVVPVNALAPLHGDVPDVEAAVLGCAFFTAYGAVHQTAALQAGETVAVVATGGVGTAIVQLARAAGAETVIAVDISDEKLQAAKKLGADHVVNSAAGDAVAQVRELTGGAGVDVAFEVLGRQQTFEQAVKMLTDGGRMVAVGIAAGQSTANVEITPLVRRGYRIMGSFGGRTRADLPAVIDLAATGVFSVQDTVTRTYSLDSADEAFQALARGEIQGRAVISMTS